MGALPILGFAAPCIHSHRDTYWIQTNGICTYPLASVSYTLSQAGNCLDCLRPLPLSLGLSLIPRPPAYFLLPTLNPVGQNT